MKNEVLEAMQQMFVQQKIKYVCDKHPGPPQHTIQMSNNDVDHTAPPQTNEVSVKVQDLGSSSGVINMGYNASVDRAKTSNSAWMENMRLNPNESCLAQRYSRVPHAGVGPAMMGSVPAAEKIPHF